MGSFFPGVNTGANKDAIFCAVFLKKEFVLAPFLRMGKKGKYASILLFFPFSFVFCLLHHFPIPSSQFQKGLKIIPAKNTKYAVGY